MQHAPDRLVRLRGGIGTAHLPEHLLLADHRRVQAAGDREEMLYGGLAVADIGVSGQIAHRHPGVLGQHLPNHRQTTVESVHHGVDLDPVTRRQHHRLGHKRRLQHLIDDFDLIGFIGAELFQDGNRCTAVRYPEEENAHGSTTWPAPLPR